MAAHIQKGWVNYPHIKFISKKIAEAIAKGNGRLIIEAPPRHGKSWLISLFTPIWFLNLWPHKRIILASYEHEAATQWGRGVRNRLEESGLVKIRQDSSAAERFETYDYGGMICAGVGGAITGKGGDLCLIDDPIKNWEESLSRTKRRRIRDWFDSTFYTRAEPGATIIVLQTRWHEDDLAGYLQKEHADKWDVISLPALAEPNDLLGRKEGAALCPERFNEDKLHQIQKAIGSIMWRALYQQRPSPVEGGLFKRNTFRYWKERPEIETNLLSIDCAFKDQETSDFVSMQFWGRRGPNKYLLDRIKGQWDFNATLQHCLMMVEKHRPHEILIEDKANGPALISVLEGRVSGVVAFDPKASKLARAHMCLPQFEGGNVYFPEEADWLDEYETELCQFPNSDNDDDVDATTQAIIKMLDLDQPSAWVF